MRMQKRATSTLVHGSTRCWHGHGLWVLCVLCLWTQAAPVHVAHDAMTASQRDECHHDGRFSEDLSRLVHDFQSEMLGKVESNAIHSQQLVHELDESQQLIGERFNQEKRAQEQFEAALNDQLIHIRHEMRQEMQFWQEEIVQKWVQVQENVSSMQQEAFGAMQRVEKRRHRLVQAQIRLQQGRVRKRMHSQEEETDKDTNSNVEVPVQSTEPEQQQQLAPRLVEPPAPTDLQQPELHDKESKPVEMEAPKPRRPRQDIVSQRVQTFMKRILLFGSGVYMLSICAKAWLRQHRRNKRKAGKLRFSGDPGSSPIPRRPVASRAVASSSSTSTRRTSGTIIYSEYFAPAVVGAGPAAGATTTRTSTTASSSITGRGIHQ